MLLLPAFYPSPETPLTGPFMRDLAHAVSRLHEVTVLAPWSRAAAPDELDGPVRVVRLPRPWRRGRVDTIQRLWTLHRLLRRLRREGSPIDVIHAHYFATGPLAVLVAPLHRLPVVITENATTCLEENFTPYQARLARFSYRRAAVVCPDSHFAEECLRRSVQPRARYEVVPEVVDIDTFDVDRRAPEQRSGPARIVSVASLEDRKGHDYLIEAVRLLIADGCDVELTIVGEGPARAALEAQSDGIPVRLVGSRSREEIRELFRDVHVFAFATLADTFGIAPVEAMAAGVPVVVTSAAGCVELIGPLGARIVPPRDAAALCRAIRDTLDKPARVEVADDLRRYCGDAAVGARLDEVYRSIV